MRPLGIGPTSPAVTAVITSSSSREAGRDIAAHDQRLAHSVPAERDQVTLAVARRSRWPARRWRTPPPVLRHRTGPGTPTAAEVAARRARRGRAFDQSLTAGDPAGPAGGLTAEEQRHRQPEAHLAARSGFSRGGARRWAASQAAALSSSRPARWHETASCSSVSASSPPSAAAAVSSSAAVAHASRAKASRPRSRALVVMVRLLSRRIRLPAGGRQPSTATSLTRP